MRGLRAELLKAGKTGCLIETISVFPGSCADAGFPFLMEGNLLSCLEAGTLRALCLDCIAACDTDMLGLAEAIFVEYTVYGLTLYFQSVFRCFEHVAEHSALVLIIAAAACIAFLMCGLAFHDDCALTAAVLRVMKTSRYVTIQFCHDALLLFSLFTEKSGKMRFSPSVYILFGQ